MYLFNVWFEGSFVGYTWADDEWSAICAVVGELAYDGDGERCYRYSATIN